ncbi:hypothetical protein ACFV30_34015 [Streptomyces sp. NPDC059752]|uniref:hypothetical protein n=1 Tax=unclassified Streptomyces TaxID=2593676 RepID=UPI0036665FB0
MLVPPRLDLLIEEQVEDPGTGYFRRQLDDEPHYLLPGQAPGSARNPLGASAFLRSHGLPVLTARNTARNTAMIEAVTDLPPITVADPFGLHPSTANHRASYANDSWPHYLAARDRNMPRSWLFFFHGCTDAIGRQRPAVQRSKELIGDTPKRLARTYRFAATVFAINPAGPVDWGDLRRSPAAVPARTSRPCAGRPAAAGRLPSYKRDRGTAHDTLIWGTRSRGEPRGQGGHVQLGVGGRLRLGRE